MRKSSKVKSDVDVLLNIKEGVARLRNTFNSGKTKRYECRMTQLKQMKKMLKDNENLFAQALTTDLGRLL